ncbi:MAG: hypothetical protein R3B89_19265 [Polyangiaceae bacterium]
MAVALGAGIYLTVETRIEPPVAAIRDPEAEQALPWLKRVAENCERYDRAEQDAERAQALKDNARLVASTVIASARGRLESKRVSSDGSQVLFTIAVGSAKFKPSLLHPIHADTEMFQHVQDAPIGACMQFSVRTLTAASILERSKVCDKDYFADFAAVELCH